MRIDAKSQRRQGIERGLLADCQILAPAQQKICVHVEPPLRHNARLHGAQRSRGRIARIHRRRNPCASRSLFICTKAFSGITVSPRTSKSAGTPAFFSFSAEMLRRHAANGAHARGHILANLPIAPRQSAHQPRTARPPSLVMQRHAEPIELQLAGVLHGQIPASSCTRRSQSRSSSSV